MAGAGKHDRLAAIPRTVADNHYRIAIEDIALGKSFADALAEGGVVRAGQEPVVFFAMTFRYLSSGTARAGVGGDSEIPTP